VWEVHARQPLESRRSNVDPRKTSLLSQEARGGFADDVKAAFRAEPALVTEVAARLLEHHFPDSLHEDILSAVGLTLGAGPATRRKRDAHFRRRVLTAYEYRCAVCGLDIRLGSVSVALDAAHIRWHQAGGPDREDNGLALCVLHHKLFDLGACTVGKDGTLLVSEQVHGTTGFHDALIRHHGRAVLEPQRPEWKPESTYLEWHGREVFKGQARRRPS
jgi:putative restriction endonuclease